MPKQLNVNLAFTADTSQAKKQIQDLFQSLSAVQTKTPRMIDDVQLRKASQAASELQHHLSAALDVDTGRIDLSKFSASLSRSNKDLDYYRKELTSIGPEGQQAFLKVAQAVANSQKSLNWAQKAAQSFLTTLKNTARWQLSSTLLHGLQGAFQQAIGYAKDLDRSLTDIQIVTGQSAEDMAKFADRANKAAKELSTTTTTYTDAALIYYQQGLSDKEVEERTNVTIKLANVTGTAASEISEQMTAIWNNFDDGTESLEHYADVLTALGASTASSSAEIANGMQQFAAVADTVGLSYEYAASALATVVAATRQSENVVGNAFKTLFSRLEGLKLGETLEDGTTLNKYSAALEKVGVNIKDQAGQLKDMDTILDELGAKWQTLSKDQQIALAQTVGGARQYTQLIALMDSWDDMQKNLMTAQNSDGTLQEQADIYEDSWKGAQARVKAEIESIYQTLIDPDKLTDLVDAGAVILKAVNGILKGLGGLPGILSQVMAIIMRISAKNMPAQIERMKVSFLQMIGRGAGTNPKSYMQDFLESESQNVKTATDPVYAMRVAKAKELMELNTNLEAQANKLSAAEKQHFEVMISEREAMWDLRIAKVQETNETEKQVDLLAEKAKQEALNAQNQQIKTANAKAKTGQGQSLLLDKLSKEDDAAITELIGRYRELTESAKLYERTIKQIDATADQWSQDDTTDLDTMKASATGLVEQIKQLNLEIKAERGYSGPNAMKVGGWYTGLSGLEESIAKETDPEKFKIRMDAFLNNPNYRDAFAQFKTSSQAALNEVRTELQDTYHVSNQTMEGMKQGSQTVAAGYNDAATFIDNAKISADDFNRSLKETATNRGVSEGIMSMASAGMQAVSVFQSLNGALDTLFDKDEDTLTKVTSGISGVSSAAIGLLMIFNSLSKISWIGAAAGPITALLTAAALIVSAISAIKKAQEAQRQAAIEAAQTEVDEFQKVIDKQKEANEQLEALKQKYNENGTVTSEYIAALENLIKVYDIQDGWLLLKQQRYEAIEDAAYAAMAAELREQSVNNTELRDAYTGGRTTADYLSDEANKVVNLGQYSITTNANGEVIKNTFADNASGFNKTLLDKGLITYASSGNPDVDAEGNEEDVGYVKLDFNGYDLTSKEVRNELIELFKSDPAKRFDRIIDQLQSEDFIKLLETEKAIAESDIQADFVDPRNFQSVADVFTQIQQTVDRTGSTWEQVQGIAVNSLGEIGQEASAVFGKIQAAGLDFNNAADQDKIKKAINYYNNSLTDEEREIYLRLDLDDESLANADDKIKQWIEDNEAESLQIKAELVFKMADSWKEDMSASEMRAWFDANKKTIEQALKDNGIDMSADDWFHDFLYQDYETQQKTLNDLGQNLSNQSLQAQAEEIERREQYATNGGPPNPTIAGAPDVTTETAAQTYNSLESEKNLIAAEMAGATDSDELAALEQRYREVGEAQTKLIEQYPELYNEETRQFETLESYNEETERQKQDLETNAILLLKEAQSVEEVNNILETVPSLAGEAAKRMNELANAVDSEIDTDEFNNLVNYLKQTGWLLEDVADTLKEDDKAAKKVANSVLRFSNAVEEVASNYDDWMSALNSGDMGAIIQATSELKDTYADLLDLPFGDLSAMFLQNTDNLNLMKQAAEGDLEAYEKLQAAVREDIMLHVMVDRDTWQGAYDEVMAKYDELHQLDDFEIGATINDDDFIAKLNQMIALSGMTATQVNDFLGTMGLSAELEDHEVPIDNAQYTWKPANYETDSITIGVEGLADAKWAFPKLDDSSQGEWIRGPENPTTVHVPTIKSGTLTKISGGDFKYKHSTAGGGGGGGGGGSTPKHTTVDRAPKKTPQETGDRYHVINNQIEDLAKQYDRLSEAEERAFGKSKLALMDQQVDLLKDQYEAQRKLREEAEKYWAEDLANLRNGAFDSDGDDIVDTLGAQQYLGMDIELDPNGTILNYDALIQAANDRYNNMVAQYNEFIDKYNALSAEEQESEKEAFDEEKENWDKKIADEEAYYDNFLGLIDQYEETQDKVQEELNKEIEQYHAILDKLLEQTQYAVQLRVDIDDDALEVIDFLMDRVADDAFAAAEKIALIGQQTELTADKIEAATDGIADIFDNHFGIDHVFDNSNADVGDNAFAAMMVANGWQTGQDMVNALASGAANLPDVLAQLSNEFTESEVDQFREYISDILDGTSELWEQRKELFEAASDEIEASNDKLDEMADQIDYLNDLTETYKNILDVLGHNGYYDITTQQILEQAKAQQQMYRDSVAAAKARNDLARETLEHAQAMRAQYAEGTEDYRLWDETVKEAQERFNETQEELMKDLEEALQHARDMFDETMTLMAEDAARIMGGVSGSLEGLSNLMDQYDKTHDTFVDAYEQVYRLNKLNAEAAKAIDETNNPKAKRELMKYQQEIIDQMRAYQEGDAQMSEWELQNLEKKLALRQAELALEEARNVKTTVRMNRDNEGNYSYIYTADEDQVAEAEANYRDKLYEMQKANAEYIAQLQNDIVSLQDEALQQVQNAAETYGYGTEAYFNAIAQIEEWYNQAVQDKYNQLELVMGANQELQQFDVDFHARMTGDMMVLDNDYITNFQDMIYSQLTGFQSSEEGAALWAQTLGDYVGQVEDVVDEYRINNEEAMNAAGLTLEESTGEWKAWGEAASESAKSVVDESNELTESIKSLAEVYNEAINGEEGILENIKSWEDLWSEVVDNLVDRNTNLATSMNDVIAKLQGVGEQIVNVNDIAAQAEENGTNGTPTNQSPIAGDTGSGGGDGNNPKTDLGGYVDDTKEYTGKTRIQPHGTSGHSYDKEYKDGNGITHWEEGSLQPHRWHEYHMNALECTVCGYETTDLTVTGGNYNTRSNPSRKTLNLLNSGAITFASGGYTGDWDSTDGKLAVLHEKELILNQDDTNKILASVNLVRQIASVIDLNAQSASGAFSQLVAASVNTGAQELQQEVHITAEFPNATNRDEILGAFDNIINLASMYANRKV